MRRNTNRFTCHSALLFIAICIPLAQAFDQNAITAQLQRAAQFLAAGKLDRAEIELNSVLRTSPEEYRALDLLGVVRVLQHRETGAEELFHRAVRSKPEFASAHAHLGLLYMDLGRTEEAVPELREAVRIDSSRTDASAALVKIWRDQAQAAVTAGNFEKALALLIDARRLAPNDPDIQYGFGMVALQMSLFADATEAFRRTLQLRENDPLALYGLGRAFMGLSKFDDARQQFARYVAQRPADASGHCALGMTLAALERVRDATSQFEQSLALSPQQTESYYRPGLVPWDRALSASDPDATWNVRPDHSCIGSYPAWPPMMAKGLYKFDSASRVSTWVKGLAKASNQGPYGQAHFIESFFPPEQGGACKCPTDPHI